jgi:outer membrane autotransporter protein
MAQALVAPEICRGEGRRIAAASVCALAVALAASGAARAQSLDESVAGALNGGCAALGPARGAQLGALCASGVGTVSTPGANSTAAGSDVGGQDQESKIKKRLRDLREKEELTGSPSKSTETTFALGGLSGFISFDYENVDKRTTGFTPGFNSDKYGGTVGLDYSFGNAVLGAAFVYSRTGGDFDNAGGDFSTRSYGGYLYGSLLPIPNLYIDAVVGYARKDMDLDRLVQFSGNGISTSGTASSSTNADEYKAGITGGYDFVQGNLTFGPRLGLNYTRNSVDAFSESGSTGLELAYDKQTVESFTSSIGVHGTMAISTSFGVLVPQVSADYIHEFLDDQKVFTAHFVQDLNASPLQLGFQNDSPDRDYFGLGVGLVLVLPHGLSPYANYRALVGDSIRTTQTATVGLRVEF